MIESFTQLLHQKTKRKGMKTAAIVADLLHISEDAAYRRIRNPESLRAVELVILAKEFNIDLNTLINLGNNWFQGEFKQINQQFTLDNLFTDINSMLQKCIERPHSYIAYGAKEIPLFYYFWFPALAAFKNFVWQRDFLNHPELKNQSFQASLCPVNPKFQTIASQYLQLPSEEIWSYETLFSTLYQIKYYQESGLFKNQNEFQAVMDDYDMLIEHIHEQASIGKKMHPIQSYLQGGDYKLYFTPLVTNDNTILFKTTRENVAWVVSQMCGVMQSDCAHWVDASQNWLETCKQNGTLLSISGNGPRNKFLRQEYHAKKRLLGL